LPGSDALALTESLKFSPLLLVPLPRMGAMVCLFEVGNVQFHVVLERIERLVSQHPADVVDVSISLDQFAGIRMSSVLIAARKILYTASNRKMK
jgi:hypothetical protein